MNGYLFRCSLVNNCTPIAYTNWGTLNVNTSCTVPSVQASNISFPAVGSNNMVINWTNGNGSRRVVKINTSNNFTAPPNGTNPTANPSYSGGEQVIYNNSGNSVLVIGLSPSTTYWFRIYEANCSGSSTLYNVSFASNNPISQITQTPLPTVNSLICTNVILNHPLISQNFTFYNDITPYSNNAPIQVCADGSTASYFKVNVSNTSLINFRILDEFGVVATNISKYGQISAVNVFNNNVEVGYTHPTFMDENGLFRACTLEVLYNGIPIPGVSFPLNIYRAPIVFVHGFVGNRATFQEMENTLLNDLMYPPLSNSPLIHRVDYFNTSLQRFYANRKVVQLGIDSVLRKARNQNYSAGKVIVISHSMGGILSRLYLQSTYTNCFYRDDIAKLIIANTPHYGTQFANWGQSNFGLLSLILQLMYQAISSTAPMVSNGAIKDMRVNSAQIMNDLNISPTIQNKVPSITLSSDELGDTSPGLRVAVRSIAYFALNNNPNIFDNEINDLIVPKSSQQSDITLEPIITQQWHVGSCANQSIMSRIESLIDANPTSSSFTLGGFPTNTLPPPAIAHPQNENLESFIQSTDSIKIISPSSGTIFNPNDNVTVNISYSGSINHMSLIVYGGSISPITIDTTNVSQINFQIPSNAVGDLNLFLLGGDSASWLAQDTTHIIVSSTSIADSIVINPATVNLPLGLQETISVNGYFNGTSTGVSIMGISGLTVQYDSAFLSYDGQGTFRGINIGTTVVVYSYQGQSDTTFFTIYDDPSVLTASFDYSLDNLCANNSVSFQDQSLGLALSYEWSFPGGVPSISFAQNPVVNYPTAGIYSVSLKTTFVNGVDSLLIDSLINVQPLPAPTIIGANSICFGDTTTLDAGSGYTNYLWSTSDITQSITTSTAGNYIVTVTDGNGCVGSATSTITVNPLPIPTISGNTAFCNGDSTTLDAGSGYTNYLWSTTETTQTITISTAGNYTVTVTDGNGCDGSATSTITFNPLPTPTITGNTSFCFGDSTTLDAGSGYTNYLWSTAAISQTITTATAGTFSVTVTDVNSCSNSTSLNVTVNSADTTVTANGFTLTANAPSATYQWIYCDSVAIIGDTNQVFVATQNGSYSVIVSQNGCTDTSSCYLIVGVGISQINSASNFSIYPNPTNGLLNIKVNGLSNEKYKIILTNTLGQILNEIEFKATNNSIETQMDMNGLASGIYFLAVTSNKIKQTFKVQKL